MEDTVADLKAEDVKGHSPKQIKFALALPGDVPPDRPFGQATRRPASSRTNCSRATRGQMLEWM